MKAKHTDGPWFSIGAGNLPGNTGYRSFNIYGASYLEEQGIFIDAIARVGRYTQGDQALVKANAALISAAPDMLEALKIIIKYARGEYPRHQEADIVGLARQAIDKAEKGE